MAIEQDLTTKLLKLGLTRNQPFILQELDPSKDDDLERFTLIEGFAHARSGLDNWIKRIVTDEDESEPLRVMICGPEQTGRSSIANYIQYKYFSEKGILPSEVVKTVTKLKNSNDEEIVLQILKDFYKTHQSVIRGKETLLENYKQNVLKATPGQFDDLWYSTIFDDTVKEFGPLNYSGYCFVVENIPQYDSINRVIDSFGTHHPLLIFVTTSPTILNEFKDRDEKLDDPSSRCRAVELDYIGKRKDGEVFEEEFEAFVLHQWHICSGGQANHPFPVTGLRSLFYGRPITYKNMIKQLGNIFYKGYLQEYSDAIMALQPDDKVPEIDRDLMMKYLSLFFSQDT